MIYPEFVVLLMTYLMEVIDILSALVVLDNK